LKSASACDEKEYMQEIDPASLQPEDLLKLVQKLRQQVAERDQEIEHLKRQLAEQQGPSAADRQNQRTLPSASEEANPGSHEDLLAQLEKIYPEGR
jgi:hypothetical protein